MASYMSVFKYLEIRLEDIKSATNNFHDSRVIGSGGFGNVYKGELSLPEGIIEVAFKRLDRKYGQGDPEFFKEIRMLSSYKHDNLISLLGYCNEGNEMILMYEYAARGSLEHILNDAALTWTQRLKICIDAAKGLSFLHDPNGTQQRVLHRDIKSANILLDESLNAKVADFGLSKICPANQPYTFLVTNTVGTYGYCDPLYMDNYQLTKESDVYSFGVVLFEVFCGKVCFENSNGKLKVFVHHWKKCHEQKKLDEIIFPDLKQQVDESSVETFVDIAYQCLQKTREQRPTMSIVVEKLKAALELKELHDLKVYEYREILKVADPPLIYNSLKELRALVSKEFPINSGETLLSITEKGEVCERIGIYACLKLEEIEDYYLQDVSNNYNSRFPRSYYTRKKGFKVHIKTHFLTPSIRYTVNIVFCKGEYTYEKQMYVALRYKLEGETETSIVYLAIKTKDDRSFIAELYQFTSDGSIFDLDVVILDHDDNYLAVEGILFKPLEKVLEDEELSNESLQWTMCSNIFKWFRDKGQEGYAVDSNGKKYFMFSARGAITSDEQSFKSSPESRFQEVAVITARNFNILKGFKFDVLSPGTTYACYLVYKSTQDQPILKIIGAPSSYIYLVSPPDTPIIGQKHDQNTKKPLNRPQLDYVPRQRSDGWMEIKVYQFYTGWLDNGSNIDIVLWTPDCSYIRGLIIESIELRPEAHSI